MEREQWETTKLSSFSLFMALNVIRDNGVKQVKTIGINTSPRKEGHVQQVAPECYSVTVSKTNTKNNALKGVRLFGIIPSTDKERHRN